MCQLWALYVVIKRVFFTFIADMAGTFESLIWLSERAAWNVLLCSLLPIPHTCLPAAAVYPLGAFSSAFTSWYRFLSLHSASLFPSLLWKSHQISISFSSATWCIQSFLWLLPAGLSWYPSTDLLELLHPVQPPTVGHLCCKLYCFLFLEFLGIQRRNALMLQPAWLSAFPRATDGLCRSLLLDTCDNSSSLFSIFVQLRCSLFDSGCCYQERSRYTAALDVVWI